MENIIEMKMEFFIEVGSKFKEDKKCKKWNVIIGSTVMSELFKLPKFKYTGNKIMIQTVKGNLFFTTKEIDIRGAFLMDAINIGLRLEAEESDFDAISIGDKVFIIEED